MTDSSAVSSSVRRSRTSASLRVSTICVRHRHQTKASAISRPIRMTKETVIKTAAPPSLCRYYCSWQAEAPLQRPLAHARNYRVSRRCKSDCWVKYILFCFKDTKFFNAGQPLIQVESQAWIFQVLPGFQRVKHIQRFGRFLQLNTVPKFLLSIPHIQAGI